MEWSTARDACALTFLLAACAIASSCTNETVAGTDTQGLDTPNVAPPDAFWSVNGEVDALALSGDTLYVGGSFNEVSPETGPLIALSGRTGARRARFPRVADGVVNSVVDDGRGGWFVGGDFRRIGQVQCRNLAHVTARPAVDRTWCPKPQGEVTALARRGSTLYVGGTLERIAGRTRRTVAALDTRSGRALAWNPDPGYFVTDLEVHGRTVYILGSFGEIGGRPHGSLAAVDAITGAVQRWDPAPPIDEHGDPLLRDIAVSDTVVYGAGSLLVAYDRRTGKRTPWNPLPGSSGYTSTVENVDGQLYVGGTFSRIAGKPRSNLAAFDANGGQLAAWSPKAQPVGVLAVHGRRVYTAENGSVRSYSATSGQNIRFANPNPNDAVRALAASPSTVVVGGAFDGAAGVARNGLAAIDVRTGAPTGWNPRLGGGSPRDAVYSIVTDDSTVYVGGLFKRVGSVARNGLAGISAKTGRATSLDPAIAGYSVDSLALAGSTLYVGGDFERASGKSREGNAAFDTSTGRLLDWYPAAGYIPIVVGDERVILGRRSLVAVDAATGQNVEWETPLAAFRVPSIDAIVVSDGTVFIGGFFDTVAGKRREGLAAVDAGSGELRDWDPGVDHLEFSRALTVDGKTVYVGSYEGLRAVDRGSGTTTHTYAALDDERVDALAIGGTTVFVGTEHGLVVVPTVGR